jgi:hypothetical protein
MILRLAFVWLGFMLAGVFGVGSALAHEGRPVFIDVTETAERSFVLKWRIPPVLSRVDLPRISLEGEGCAPTQAPLPVQLAGYQTIKCTGELARPTAVLVEYPSANPVLSTLVKYAWLNGDSNSLLSGPSESRVALPLEISAFDVIASYTETGVEHILSGLDHLLFVSCLLLITAAIRQGAIKRAVFAITGFTLGHSITLAMVTLGSLTPPSRLVETLIAFSILIMALEIAKANTASLTYRHPALIAVLFGLLHGLGFAGALKEIGLPYDQEILALVFFNVGVEVGQLLFVAVLCVIFAIIRSLSGSASTETSRFRGEGAMRFVFTRGVGSLSLYWMFTRFLEL